jgi:ATP-dependent Clp protease ATP-binding subunit ClpC
MPIRPQSADLEAVLAQAHDIAAEAEQRLSTAHVILALFTIPNPAERELRKRGIDEDRLLEVLKNRSELHDEPPDVILALEERLAQTAESTGAQGADCLHLLVALGRLQASSAHRMLRAAGIDLALLRNQIIAQLTRVMPRRLHPNGPDGAAAEPASFSPRPATTTGIRGDTELSVTLPSATAAAPTPRHRPVVTQVESPRPPGPRPQSAFTLDPKEFPWLQSMGRNLCWLAASGRFDPVVGREREVEQVLDILSKKKANNPCLIGEPGVGKTAVVEGLAQTLVDDQLRRGVPGERLVVELEMGALLAGTHLRGSLSERLNGIKDEMRRAGGRVVVFIDELHTLVGAGATGDGSQDAANELKAALSSGEFPCIGATTPSEYRKYVENDLALARRFQRVYVEEPNQAQALAILRGAGHTYASHHEVEIDDEALETAVRLSVRYLRDRRLPDKAFNVIDLAGARAHREGRTRVGREDVARVVAGLAHLPEDKLLLTDTERFMQLEEALRRQIVGHREVVATIARALRRASAGFGARRPMGSFLFLGATGVGKSEMALVLADALFQGRDAVVSFDMSEYSEPHSGSRLIGSPPGYVGYEEPGQLTEAVRRRPYALVLLDEVEKAHFNVLQLLLQILDEGRLTDAHGRTVDFTSTILVLTSNCGSDLFRPGRRLGFDTGPATHSDLTAQAQEAARRVFSPELWNRIEHRLVFMPLDLCEVREIARLQILASASHLEEERGITYRVEEEVLDFLAQNGGYQPELGARPMRRAIERLIEGELAQRILAGEFKTGDVIRVAVRASDLDFQKVQ